MISVQFVIFLSYIRRIVHNGNFRQVVYTCVPMLPSSIIRYCPKSSDGLLLGR